MFKVIMLLVIWVELVGEFHYRLTLDFFTTFIAVAEADSAIEFTRDRDRCLISFNSKVTGDNSRLFIMWSNPDSSIIYDTTSIMIDRVSLIEGAVGLIRATKLILSKEKYED